MNGILLLLVSIRLSGFSIGLVRFSAAASILMGTRHYQYTRLPIAKKIDHCGDYYYDDDDV